MQRDGDKHIVYRLLSESGPDHAKTFHMVVEINGVTYEAGSGKSKKIAEQHAAQLTLEKLMANRKAPNGAFFCIIVYRIVNIFIL